MRSVSGRTELLAGADARPITPALDPARPVYLAGFQNDRRATGIDADLEVRTLALAARGGRVFVLAVCDLVGVLRSDTLQIRASVTDLDADVVVAATHTHSGPDTIGLWGPDQTTRGADEDYLAEVRATVVDSIRAVVTALEPARVFAATTRVQGVVQNYRDPHVLDDAVGVLAFDRPDAGGPIATLVNVGVHPEVLDGDSTLISPDMAGACRASVDVARGGITVWASGDLGGMQSPAEGPRTPEEVRRKGGALAGAAVEALIDAPPLTASLVRYRSGKVALPLWNPMYRVGLETGLLRGDVHPDGTLTTEIGLLDLGGARIAFWPGEVLPKLGLACKTALHTPHPFLVGLANDELGYILAREDFVEPADWDDPGAQYEESMSVGPETGPILEAALGILLPR